MSSVLLYVPNIVGKKWCFLLLTYVNRRKEFMKHLYEFPCELLFIYFSGLNS